MFRKKAEKHAKKFDKLVTGLIIGGALASIVGISKSKKGQELTENVKKSSNGFFRKTFSLFGKSLVGVLKIFTRKK